MNIKAPHYHEKDIAPDADISPNRWRADESLNR
jgi:hypothetical protein